MHHGVRVRAGGCGLRRLRMLLREIIALMRKRFDADPEQKKRQPLSFQTGIGPHCRFMQIHASCAAREGAGVLLMGPPGSGKSDLLLRLLDRGSSSSPTTGWRSRTGCASAPPSARGPFGSARARHRAPALSRIGAAGSGGTTRAERAAASGAIPPSRARPAACHRSTPAPRPPPPGSPLALDCALGRASQRVGAFAL